MTPAAIGYLRTDESGARQDWDEIQIRSLARRLGYTLAKTIALGPYTDTHIQCVIAAVCDRDADAVIVPSLDHFDSRIPDLILAVADIITVDPHRTYPRHRSSNEVATHA
ncbi:hypothetical protein [Nocardia sp. NPDC005978]|uniref:hypothetical protein n=1 Tax=unclassified Nocardia TaxID=2637762 RepID=UPI0033A88098